MCLLRNAIKSSLKKHCILWLCLNIDVDINIKMTKMSQFQRKMSYICIFYQQNILIYFIQNYIACHIFQLLPKNISLGNLLPNVLHSGMKILFKSGLIP